MLEMPALMVKNGTKPYALIALALAAIVTSCGDNSSPASPSTTTLPAGTISLKATAPILQSPAHQSTTEGLTPVLRIVNSDIHDVPRVVPALDVTFTYEFKVWKVVNGKAADVPVWHTKGVSQTATSTSVAVTVALERDITYQWQARAEIGDEKGLWSRVFTFTIPKLLSVSPPAPKSPTDGSTTTSFSVNLVVDNGAVMADAGPVSYEFSLQDEGPTTWTSPSNFSAGRGSSTTTARFGSPLAASTQWWWRVRGTNGTVTSDWSATFTFTTPSAESGSRTPDPSTSGKLPLPDESQLVRDLANQYPAEIADSCQEHGGTWDFMDRVVEALRVKDTRWGYNCKRGNCNDVSLDVVTYFHSTGAGDVYNNRVYIIDIILGHCGDTPRSAWLDVTDLTKEAGTTGGFIYPR
jgi:hypothetical protein